LLSSELASLQANQRQMLAINKAYREAGRPAPDDLAGWQRVADHPEVMMNVNDFSRIRRELAGDAFLLRTGKGPIPAYRLTNNGANIRRIEARIAYLSSIKAKPSTEREVAGVRVEEDTEAVRLRLHFPDKPASAIIAELKARGFRWAPSEGAWQRQLSNSARWAAECVLKMVEADMTRAA
jgi:hypothetical protein